MSEILKKLDEVQSPSPEDSSPQADGRIELEAQAVAAPTASRSDAAKRRLADLQFKSRQLAGRFMSAVSRKTGGLVTRRTERTKTMLFGSFAAGLALVLIVLFFLPSFGRKRTPMKTRTVSITAGKRTRRPATKDPSQRPSPKAPGAITPSQTSSANPGAKDLALVRSAEELVKAKRMDAAIAKIEKETGKNPFLTRSLLQLSIYYQAKKQQDKAIATLMRILQVEPKNPLAYNNLGMIQLRLKRYNEAVLFLEKACENAPEIADPWLNMAIAYEQKLRWSDSVRAYNRYLQLMSGDEALSRRSKNEEKILAAVRIRLLRLKAFSAADDRVLASSVEEVELEESADTEEVDPNPIRLPASDSGASVAPSPSSSPVEESSP